MMAGEVTTGMRARCGHVSAGVFGTPDEIERAAENLCAGGKAPTRHGWHDCMPASIGPPDVSEPVRREVAT